ncbi:MAG: helix-turn-helix domain-containing protein [Candidatus Omnitrophica bacterium]|nr:helix-turn-helix domain-containing protein [Candidatus Omnitrophota bacterium]
METAGARLKKLRLEKGISLEEVQKKTKIHLEVLKSIEDDTLVNLNPVYIKGFVKIYCDFLGVAPAEFLSGYKDSGAVISSIKPGAKDDGLFWGTGTKKPFLKPQVLAIIVLIVAFLFLTLGIVNLVKFVSKVSSKKSHKQLVLPKPKPVKKVQPKASSKPKAILPATRALRTTEAEKLPVAVVSLPAENPEPGVRIGIHALDDCWVQARIDGKIIFQNILKKGRFESWSAKDKVELALGSAGSVRLEVNGKLIPSLGRKSQVLKNIQITKDGLKVGK